MEVAEEENISALQRPLHHQLCVVIDRVEFAGGADPLTVKVLAHERASIVANDYSIWVQHWNYFEDEGVAEELCLWIVADKEVDHAFHDPASVGLTWMHT